MSKGIIYIMTTANPDLIKIGKTESDQYKNRMTFLEKNGYSNLSALKRYFAIEVDKYDEKEKLLQNVFSKSRVGNSELFAVDKEIVEMLLSSFEGEKIFPENKTKEEIFETAEIASNGDFDGVYIHKNKDGSVVASLKVKGNKYYLSANSLLSEKFDNIIPSGWRNIRKKIQISKEGKTVKDVVCSSPSMAAAFVMGYMCNGLTFWKNKVGKSLKELLQ